MAWNFKGMEIMNQLPADIMERDLLKLKLAKANQGWQDEQNLRSAMSGINAPIDDTREVTPGRAAVEGVPAQQYNDWGFDSETPAVQGSPAVAPVTEQYQRPPRGYELDQRLGAMAVDNPMNAVSIEAYRKILKTMNPQSMESAQIDNQLQQMVNIGQDIVFNLPRSGNSAEYIKGMKQKYMAMGITEQQIDDAVKGAKPEEMAIDFGGGNKLVFDNTGKAHLVKENNQKSEEELALSAGRLKVSQENSALNRDKYKNISLPNLGLRTDSNKLAWDKLYFEMNPDAQAAVEQGKTIGKESGKGAYEAASKADQSRITLAKIDQIQTMIDDPSYTGGVWEGWAADWQSKFPILKDVMAKNPRAALSTYAPVLMADLKQLLGPQISNADAQLMLTMTGGDFMNKDKVGAALKQIRSRLEADIALEGKKLQTVQSPKVRGMITPQAGVATAPPGYKTQRNKVTGETRIVPITQ